MIRVHVALLLVVLAVPAVAETVELSIVPTSESTQTLDFGTGLQGVTDVQVRITGYCEDLVQYCDGPGDTYSTSYYPWTCWIELQQERTISFTLPNEETFDFADSINLPDGVDWSDLNDGCIDLHFWHQTDALDWPDCHHPFPWPSPAYEALTLTVTCDSLVPNDSEAWGEVKALYR